MLLLTRVFFSQNNIWPTQYSSPPKYPEHTETYPARTAMRSVYPLPRYCSCSNTAYFRGSEESPRSRKRMWRSPDIPGPGSLRTHPQQSLPPAWGKILRPIDPGREERPASPRNRPERPAADILVLYETACQSPRNPVLR